MTCDNAVVLLLCLRTSSVQKQTALFQKTFICYLLFRSTDRWDNWCGIWCGAFTIYHIFRPTPTWVPRSQRHSCTQFNEYRRAWWIAPSAHMLNMSASITEALLYSIQWVQEGVMDCSISPHVAFSFVKQNCNELSLTFNSVPFRTYNCTSIKKWYTLVDVRKENKKNIPFNEFTYIT